MSEESDNDEGFLDGDIVDNIFNQKDANAHLEMDFESATKYVRGLAGSAKQEDLLYFYGRYKQVTQNTDFGLVRSWEILTSDWPASINTDL